MAKKLTNLEFIQKAKIIFPNYDYSDTEYINTRSKVTVNCPIHGSFTKRASLLLQGQGCPKCSYELKSIKNRDSIETFLQKAIQINNEYDYSKVQYINQHTKVIVTCVKHGDFEITPNNLLNGKGCPKCNQSKGEKLISKILNEKQLSFIYQYIIKAQDCKVRNIVKIDFYLPDYNTFIEYNGIQHYIPNKHFGGKVVFDDQIQRDEWVRNYCKQKNINLIEIPYSMNELQIRDILDKLINNE